MAGERFRPGRLNQRVARMTGRLDDLKVPLGIVVLAIGAFLAYVGFSATTGPPFQPRYEIAVDVPAGSPVLRRGQEIRIGGKLAGLVSSVDPDREDGGSRVKMNITKTEFRPLPADTTAYVRVHSIVYRTWIELTPGESADALEHGDNLREPAASGVDLLEVVDLFDQETRRNLRATVVNLGFGTAGRGQQVNEALARLVPMTRNLQRQLDAVTRERGAIGALIAGAARTTSGARGIRGDDVDALIGSADAVAGTVAARSSELRATLRLLPPFEDQVLRTATAAEPLLRELTTAAVELEPAVATLNGELPGINRLLRLGDVLRTETDRIADVVDPVLRAARPVVFGLFPTMTTLGPLNADLAELIATVEPYARDIDTSGTRVGNATSYRVDAGGAPGEPAGRVLPVLVPHPCSNPIPDPGEADRDRC